MQSNRFLREANGNVLAVVTLVIASLLGIIGLTTSDEPLDRTQWSAVSSAHAGAAASSGTREASVARNDATRIDAADEAARIRATEAWSADDSAQGTRPDAAH